MFWPDRGSVLDPSVRVWKDLFHWFKVKAEESAAA